jgi:mannose-6-phosphate isomerase-like protein (cupin superfamily)
MRRSSRDQALSIRARLDPEVTTMTVQPTDIQRVLAGRSELDLDANPSLEDIRAAFPKLASFDAGDITIGRWSGQSPWERHVEGDELFLVLDGEIEFTLLSDHDSTKVRVPKGSIFVIPRAAWHRAVARHATTLTVRACDHGPVSFAEDPRVAGEDA